MPDKNCSVPRRNRWDRLVRLARYWYLRVIRQRSSPHNIALGLGLGMFIGAMPIIPFQTVTVIVLAFALRTSKLSAWLATCYSNVFTMVPFYSFLYMLGKLVYPVQTTFDSTKLEMSQMIAQGWDMFLAMVFGGFIFGIPASVVTYFLSRQAVVRYRKLRDERRRAKRDRQLGRDS